MTPMLRILNEPCTDDVPHLSDFKTQSPDDREMRDELHTHRYMLFQHGLSVREIAEIESVNERQIYVSILHCETRLPKADVLANRRFRNAIVAQRKLAEKYTQTLSDLMDGKGGRNWSQRSRALQHFQRTVGFDGGGVRVNINNQAAVVGSGNSFEKALERVKQMHAEAARQKQLDAVGAGSDDRPTEPI